MVGGKFGSRSGNSSDMDLAAWWYSSHSEGMLLPLAFGEFINRGDSTNYRNIILRNTEREIQYLMYGFNVICFSIRMGFPQILDGSMLSCTNLYHASSCSFVSGSGRNAWSSLVSMGPSLPVPHSRLTISKIPLGPFPL